MLDGDKVISQPILFPDKGRVCNLVQGANDYILPQMVRVYLR